ncbi:MAG: DUF3667 domain-containing protein [Cyclobacteriaceae bacterium]|nr:DUF3667 domain-containing protein [Cyclobacteriaceae bacterium]
MRLFSRKRTDLFDYAVARECLNCGTSFQGKFCNRCGEKVVDKRERSIRHFVGEVLNAFTFLDGKFPRSVKSILFHPGKLASDNVRGVRVPYMKPVSLFFVANFLYFLFPFSEVFNTSLNSQLKYQEHSELAQQMVQEKVAVRGLTFADFEISYNDASKDWAKLLLIVIVFMFSLVLGIVNYSKKRFYADHLTASFEYMAYTLLFTTIAITSILVLVVRIAENMNVDLLWIFNDEKKLLLPLIAISTLQFLWRMQLRFYANHWLLSMFKALLLFFGFFGVVMVYRFILFFVTFWSV